MANVMLDFRHFLFGMTPDVLASVGVLGALT